MKAIWNGQTIAEADRSDLIYIEGNWYFPPKSVNKQFLKESVTPYHCPWKGDCTYYDVGSGDTVSKDAAWTYKQPKPTAIDIVKKDFSGYFAFWHDVTVEAAPAAATAGTTA
jgi:uncharacterized protein (DUF427 family)